MFPSSVPTAPVLCCRRDETEPFEGLVVTLPEVSFVTAFLPGKELLCAVLVSNIVSKCCKVLSLLVNTNYSAIKLVKNAP